MCAIYGVINTTKREINLELINTIIRNSNERGSDGYGYMYKTFNGNEHTYKSLDNASTFEGLSYSDISVLIGNARAEPTTEFIEHKTVEDQQPYQFNNTTIVHNGTISNDKELKNTYNFKTPTEIDSYVIATELDNIGLSDIGLLKNVLINKLIGSYATIVTDGEYVLIATNYKPIYVLNDDGVYYIASLEHFFGKYTGRLLERPNITEILPYTFIRINLNTFQIVQGSLYKDNIKKKALVCASSGLDSTVATTWAIKNGYDVTLLHFDYDCRATMKEKESIKKIAEHSNLPLYTIKTDFFKNVIGGSRLYDGSEITKTGVTGAELAIEWVPARNLIFMSIAAGFCEAHDINYLILGGNLEESGAYADNEYIFQKKFNDLLPNSLNLQHRLQILTPLANLMKRDIVKMGLELGAPLNLTWSCYEHGEKHCGKCGPCFMRKTAFKMLKQQEVIEYEN